MTADGFTMMTSNHHLLCYIAMLYNINMARGESGRIVLEIDPSQKDDLYSALIKDGLTLKEWFLQQAAQYLRDHDQMQLFSVPGVSEEPALYKANSQQATASSAKVKNSRAKAKPK